MGGLVMNVEGEISERSLVSESNRLKVTAGLAFDETVTSLLNQLVKAEVIRSFDSPVSFAHRDYAYSHQYKADYLIETIDSKIIVVRGSTSFRQDRIKVGFYDFDGILRNSSIGRNIIASIYLVGNTEHSSFNKHRNMLENGEYYCPATHLFYLREFVDFLNEYKLRFEIEREEEKTELNQQALSVINPQLKAGVLTGSDFGKAGNQLEKNIVELLADNDKLLVLKNNSSSCHSVYRKIVSTICGNEGIDIQSILSIQATNVITMLKSTGSPKTDVKLSIKLKEGMTHIATLSIKNTKASKVSCHDYKAEAFIRVLECENTKLAEYLELFQKFPTYSSFEEEMDVGYSLEEFVKLLNDKGEILSEWATMGMHDSFNLIDPETQISKYLFINNWETGKNTFYIYKEYLDIISKQRNEKFNVPFAWTYPSGCKGERIQLKLPVIL